MIDIKLLRENPDLIRASQTGRGEDAGIVDQVLALDEKRRAAINEFEALRAEQNTLSKAVGSAKGDEKAALLENAKDLRDSFVQGFGYTHKEEVNGLPIIKWGQDKKNIIVIVHPFWSVSNLNYNENWLAKTMTAQKRYVAASGGSLSIIDTFNLHRRPGWCYEKLVIR